MRQCDLCGAETEYVYTYKDTLCCKDCYDQKLREEDESLSS